jgi:ABC-type nitrate/sulfonate/bicarbonate transport system permease component
MSERLTIRMKTLRSVLSSPKWIQAGFIAAVFVVWYVVTLSGRVSSLFLPSLGAVYAALAEIVASGAAVQAVGATLRTVLIAYAGAAVLGATAGFAITRSQYLCRLLEPLLSSLFAIPLTLFFPLFLLFFGIGPGSKVAYGMTYAFFPIALNTISGLNQVDGKLIAAARSMGAPPHLLFRRVLLPGALPVILTGLRIGFFICFATVLGGETLSSISGLGHEVANSAQLMDSARMFAWILVVIATSFCLVVLAGSLERLRGDLRGGESR